MPAGRAGAALGVGVGAGVGAVATGVGTAVGDDWPPPQATSATLSAVPTTENFALLIIASLHSWLCA